MAFQFLPATDIKEKIIYSPQGVMAEWAINPVDVDVKQSPEGMEFSFSAFKPEGQEWPRLLLSGPKTDFSAYSQLIFEIEALDDEEQTLLIGARSGIDFSQGNSAVAAVAGGRKVQKVILDISDGSPLEQSHIHEMGIGMHRPEMPGRYRLRGIKAIRNPDFPSRRDALTGSIRETQEIVDTYSNLPLEAGKDNKEISEARQMFNSAKKDYEKQSSGYVTTVTAKLERVRFLLGKYGMRTRQEPLTIWRSPLGKAVRTDTLPDPSQQTPKEIQQRVVQGQYLAIPINFSASDEEQKLEISLPEDNGGRIALRQALWAKARDGSMTADAIAASAQTISVTVAPFSTEQILLWVDAKNGPVTEGKLETKLQVSQAGQPLRTIPISITITDMKLPERLPLATANWAYFFTSHAVQTKGLEAQARDNLRDYGMNTWVIHYTQIPHPKLDADGQYVGLEEKSLATFRQVMQLLAGKAEENFIIWLGFHQEELVRDLERPGVLEPYLKAMNTLLDEYKVSRERRYLGFWDEPDARKSRQVVEWMKKIRGVDSTFLFYDNTSHPPSQKAELDDFLSHCNLWVPNWEAFVVAKPEVSADLMRLHAQQKTGFYRCLMSRNNKGVNIYEYYRLMGWYAIDRDLTAIMFWVYDFFENPWDGTQGSGSGGTVIYSKDGQLLTSRRWEMVREAIDDYRLAMLALGTNERIDIKSSPELKTLCDNVLKAPANPEEASLAREQLIDLALQRRQLR